MGTSHARPPGAAHSAAPASVVHLLDLNFLLPLPLGFVFPRTETCPNRWHAARADDYWRCQQLLAELFKKGMPLRDAAKQAELAPEPLRGLLLGESRMQDDVYADWCRQLGIPPAGLHDTHAEPTSKLPYDQVLFYDPFSDRVCQWPGVPASKDAAWFHLTRHFLAFDLIAEVLAGFEFGCVCEAVTWMIRNRRAVIPEKPIPGMPDFWMTLDPTRVVFYRLPRRMSDFLEDDFVDIVCEVSRGSTAFVAECLTDMRQHVRQTHRNSVELLRSTGHPAFALWQTQDWADMSTLNAALTPPRVIDAATGIPLPRARLSDRERFDAVKAGLAPAAAMAAADRLRMGWRWPWAYLDRNWDD